MGMKKIIRTFKQNSGKFLDKENYKLIAMFYRMNKIYIVLVVTVSYM